jgi:hypothetical protein
VKIRIAIELLTVLSSVGKNWNEIFFSERRSTLKFAYKGKKYGNSNLTLDYFYSKTFVFCVT